MKDKRDIIFENLGDYMEWLQVFTIIATLLGGIFYIHYDVREIRQDMKQQNSRVDKLYEMFIDLLKNKNTP